VVLDQCFAHSMFERNKVRRGEDSRRLKSEVDRSRWLLEDAWP
jgi:hypothetical protein